MADAADEGVIVAAAVEEIMALAAVEPVVADAADEGVVEGIAGDRVVESVAGAGERRAEEHEMLDAGAERVVERRADRVGPASGFGNRVASVLDLVRVVAFATAQLVGAAAAVEDVAAGVAAQLVGALAAVRMSLPASPLSLSLPSPPSRVSLPSPPLRMLSRALPTMRLSMALPVPVMAADNVGGTMLPNAGQEGISRRILRSMAFAVALAVLISLPFAQWRVTTGLFLGGLLSLLNHHWLRSSTTAAFSVIAGGTSRSSGSLNTFSDTWSSPPSSFSPTN